MDKLKHITVVAGLIYNKDKYLIGRRKPNDLGGGYWEFPGGKLEEGEEVENCLRRELFEEIGVIAKRYTFLILMILNIQPKYIIYIFISFIIMMEK